MLVNLAEENNIFIRLCEQEKGEKFLKKTGETLLGEKFCTEKILNGNYRILARIKND
jgi:hypothetical protein